MNKFIDKLRNVFLHFPDLYTSVDVATSTDVHSWGPSSTLPHPSKVFTTNDFEDTEMKEPTPHMDTPTSTLPKPTSTSPASEEFSRQTKNKGRGNEMVLKKPHLIMS